MALCLAGLLCFALALLLVQIGELAGVTKIAGALRDARLVALALGSVAVVFAMPRFLFVALGLEEGAAPRLFFLVMTALMALLSVVRAVMGWSDEARIAPAVILASRVIIYAFMIVTFSLIALRHSRIPDRGPYKATLARLGTLLLLVPIVILDDLRVIVIEGFPSLGGLAIIAAISVIAILHTRRNFARPKYAEGRTLSAYFIERFGISEREGEVAAALLEGLGNAAIADKLCISVRTVENHLHRIYQKTGIGNRLQLYSLLRADSD
jgi:DNA-binding CsgD family transcriptional regulator